MKIKALNLYACLGGNRYKWDEVAKEGGFELEVTAVELDPELARMYQERFPNDIVIVADAHQYLLDHYKEFDFIWSSPPCPTHSRLKLSQVKGNGNHKPEYPSMMLYEEVIFLKHYFNGLYVVENVIPYYKPLIEAKKRARHLYWTNFNLPNDLGDREELNGYIGGTKLGCEKNLSRLHEIDLSSYKGEQRKDKIARNLVDFEAGRTIFQTAVNAMRGKNENQIGLFERITN